MQRPLTGSILGILIGVGAAIFMARQGIWPADQITLFFLPGILGLLGLLLLTMGRAARGQVTLVIALLLLVPMLVWGALGFGSINETGQLNGGCEVTAASDIDETSVVDTSRGDPFAIDPDGGLAWAATSPTVFEDYEWALQVVVGGIPITIDSGTEANEAGDTVNGGEVDDVRSYAEEKGIDLDLYRGVYEVGGSAASCDGFGFVEVTGDGLDTVALIALIAALTLLVVLIVLTFAGREAVVVGTEAETETVVEEGTTSSPLDADDGDGPAPDDIAETDVGSAPDGGDGAVDSSDHDD
ncbi:MAG: hypothetical protein WAL25_11395 [Acidimicrobiia bacterium]